MKAKPLAVVLLSAAALAAADQASVAGRWQIHASIAGNESDTLCTLTQRDAEVAGSCDTLQGGPAAVAGKVDGDKVTFGFKTEYNGTPITVNYQGKLDAGKISGTVSVPEFAVEGEFTATQAK
jgi:hypothetical protein